MMRLSGEVWKVRRFASGDQILCRFRIGDAGPLECEDICGRYTTDNMVCSSAVEDYR